MYRQSHSWLNTFSYWCKTVVFVSLVASVCSANANQSSLILVPQYEHTSVSTPTDSTLSAQLQIDLLREAFSESFTISKFESEGTDCTKSLCGFADSERLMLAAKQQQNAVQLVLMYSFPTQSDPKLKFTAIDVTSDEVLLNKEHPLANIQIMDSEYVLGIAQSFVDELVNFQTQQQFNLVFDEFAFDELEGLTTFLLANNANQSLRLNRATQTNTFFERYFPTTNSDYSLQSSLLSSQILQQLRLFFEQREIAVRILFEKTAAQQPRFYVTRESNPYLPSVLQLVLLVLLMGGMLILGYKRTSLNRQLTAFADARNADEWLSTYKHAALPFYFLRGKWALHHSYWSRLFKESEELATQAREFFVGGDVKSAKLFITKSLYANSANKSANQLVDLIEDSERTTGKQNKLEHWLNNKIAKALNNYRNRKTLKAMRHLYQALTVAKQNKSLRKQEKAINRLVKKFINDEGKSIKALEIKPKTGNQRLLLCNSHTIQLGRKPKNEASTWVSIQDSVFYINHKSLSRVGQHCVIETFADGFLVEDLSSKTGTFVNEHKIKPKQMRILERGDSLRLGGKEDAVTLQTQLSSGKQCLYVSFDQTTIDKADQSLLKTRWPDVKKARHTQMVCMQEKVVVYLDQEKHQLGAIDAADFNNNDKQASLLPLCLIHLGEKAQISPWHNQHQCAHVLIDNVPLLGTVPLNLPCQLHCGDVSFSMNAFDKNAKPIKKNT